MIIYQYVQFNAIKNYNCLTVGMLADFRDIQVNDLHDEGPKTRHSWGKSS
jgi:hypothetical protein